MSRRKKPKHLARKGTLEESQFRVAANGSHPAQVSGMFQKDPTFEDFRKILRQQREADYRRASEEIEALTDHAFVDLSEMDCIARRHTHDFRQV